MKKILFILLAFVAATTSFAQMQFPGLAKDSTLMNGNAAIQTRNKWLYRATFDKTIGSGLDNTQMTLVCTGAGQTVSQSGGNLVITAGTTARSETIVRSNSTFSGSIISRAQITLSQRIANNNFYVEMVDVIGDGLAMTVNSSTSITVTIPSNPFTAQNSGQSVIIGNITGVAGVPGRYTIASVSGNNVTFVVSGWPASGTGTVSLFGWNYYQLLYSGTNATSASFDTQRNGWNSGSLGFSTSSTAAPGDMGIMTADDGNAYIIDQAVTAATSQATAVRGSRVVNVPVETTPLYCQIRVLNSTTGPGSSTTLTVGLISVERYFPVPVTINNIKPQGVANSMPVNVQGAISATILSGSLLATATPSAPYDLNPIVSSTITSNTTLAQQALSQGAGYTFNYRVTAFSGTNAWVIPSIQVSYNAGTTWIDIYQFPPITATGEYTSPLLPITARLYRVVETVGGTTPSITRVLFMQVSGLTPSSFVRQHASKTINPNTLNSTTGSLICDFTSNAQLIVSMGAATTDPVISLQASEDNANWYNIGTPLTATANSVTTMTATNVQSRYLRAQVSTAGSGATLNYAIVKSF